MKRYIRLLVSMVFAMPLLAFATTALVNAESTATTNSSTTTTTTTTDTEKPDDTGLLDRLAEHKATLKTKLTTVEQANIKAKCKVSQNGAVNSLSGRIKGIETSRNEVYNNLIDRLNSLVTKLKAKNVDTTKLDAEIVTLKTKIATFQADLAKYKQGVIDLKSMDCVTDPTAFKAALESTRTLHDQVAKDALDVKAYVNDTIKPTLKDIRTQLAATEKTSSTTGGTQ